MNIYELNNVMILGKQCFLNFGYYPNQTIAIQCYHKESLYWVATINWEQRFEGEDYTKKSKFPIVVIKNYGENSGIYQALLSANVITIGPYLSGSDGAVQIGILTKKWQKIAKKQLRRIN